MHARVPTGFRVLGHEYAIVHFVERVALGPGTAVSGYRSRASSLDRVGRSSSAGCARGVRSKQRSGVAGEGRVRVSEADGIKI